MIPFDTRNYRAPISGIFDTHAWSVIAVFLLVILLGWMGERDSEDLLQRVQEAAVSQCDK